MKIKYVNKVTFCCGQMENYIKFLHLIIYGEKEVRFNLSLRNCEYVDTPIYYCPFCGEKIEYIK